MYRVFMCAVAALLALGVAEAKTYAIKAGPNADAEAQGAFAAALSQDSIRFGEGRFTITKPLVLRGDRIEIRGKGADKTIIDFQSMAGEGDAITVQGNGVELRDFFVANAKGAGLVVSGSNVNVETIGAQNALGPGIVLDRVQTAIVQKNAAYKNMIGIEVRNSRSVDLLDNVVSGNGIGVQVDDRPGAPPGGPVRVVRNQINGNAGQGIGVDIVAAKDVAVLQNKIGDHGTANILVHAYAGDIADAAFNPLSRNISMVKNEFGRAGFLPASDWAPAAANGAKFGDIVWDGARSYVAGNTPRTEPVLFAIYDNNSTDGPLTFANLGLEAAGSPASEANPTTTWPIVANFALPEPVKVK